MVEIEQEEFERLKSFEELYNQLNEKHTKLEGEHNTLKDDYIALSRGQQQGANNKDDFDTLCQEKFNKK